jgi:hypothetical protein
VEGDVQSQSAPAPSEAPAAGTATETATDVAASTEVTQESTPPAGTGEDASSTAAAEATATDESPRTRRERQREARKQAAPPPDPVKSREEIAAEIRAQDAADRAAQERQQRDQQRYAQWIGEDRANPNDPNSPTRYQQLWNEANTPIPDGDDKFFTDETRALVQRTNAARSKLQELNERRGMLQEVWTPAQQQALIQTRTDVGNEIEALIAAKGLPAAEIIASIKDPSTALQTVFNDVFARLEAAKDAHYKPQIEELEEDLAAEREENDSLRRQLGGSAPQPLRGGVAAGVNGYASVADRLIQEAGSVEAYIERAKRGDYANLDLTR